MVEWPDQKPNCLPEISELGMREGDRDRESLSLKLAAMMDSITLLMMGRRFTSLSLKGSVL